MVAVQINPTAFVKTNKWVKFQDDQKDDEEFDEFVKNRFEASKLFEEFSNNRFEASQRASTPIFRRTYSVRRDEKKYSYISELDKSPTFVSKHWLRPQKFHGN